MPKRVFIVGCPRSGTTLLQAALGSHPSIFTIPETHFFRKLRGRLQQSGRFGLVSPRSARKSLSELASVTGSSSRVAPGWPLIGAYGREFIRMMDLAAVSRSKLAWVEKSPVHLHYIDEIRGFAPDAIFIHMLRDGREVVASLLALCASDPKRWVPQMFSEMRPRDVSHAPDEWAIADAAVSRWNRDVGLTRFYRSKPSNIEVVYDELLAQPRAVLERVCHDLSVGFHERMLDHEASAPEVVGQRRGLGHMQRVFEPLSAGSRRFDSLRDDLRRHIQISLAGGGDVRKALGP